jgi:hypothetical protein
MRDQKGVDMAAKTCPDCHGEMVEGVILDKIQGGQLIPKWTEGHPERSFWVGAKATGKESFSVETYRCVNCGLLRSYANEPA